MLHCWIEVCYTARSKYAIVLGPSILQCSDHVCYIVWSKYVTLLDPSMLYCSVEVCCTARSKYAILLGSSILYCSVQVYYTAQSEYATLPTQTLSPGDPKVGVICLHIVLSRKNHVAYVSVPGNRVPRQSYKTVDFSMCFPHRSTAAASTTLVMPFAARHEPSRASFSLCF